MLVKFRLPVALQDLLMSLDLGGKAVHPWTSSYLSYGEPTEGYKPQSIQEMQDAASL